MLQIGKYNKLRIVKEVDFGLYLDGHPYGEILLPIRYVEDDMQIDDFINVFVYTDSEDRIIATTLKPYGIVGDFVNLKVIDTSQYGAFLDWGLPKDLFVPFKEQNGKMEVGQRHLVRIYLDNTTERVTASAKISKFLETKNDSFQEKDVVELVIAQKTDIGYKVIIDNAYLGVLYFTEVFRPLSIGQKLSGYIKNIREDDLIDVTLQKQGYIDAIPDAAQTILDKLNELDGMLPVSDKSSPEDIYNLLFMSKKSFKKAVGQLYKNHLITIEKHNIYLIKD